MDKETYLIAFFRKNPRFTEQEKVIMMSRAMKNIISQAYDMGYRQGLEDAQTKGTEDKSSGAEMFEQLFGKGGYRG